MSNYVFPLDASKISWTTKLKSKWNVETYKSVGQIRKSLVQQTRPQWTFDLSFPKMTKKEIDKLLSFHALCKGSWHPFWYKDFENYGMVGRTLQKDASGNYQAIIPYGTYEEPAEKIDHVVVWVNGEKSNQFTVTGGKISVTAAAGSDIKFDYEYYYKVVFKDEISISQKFYDWYKVSLQLEVVQ